MTIPWKVCLLFGQRTVAGISHNSPHEYRSLHMSGVDSARFYFLPGYV